MIGEEIQNRGKGHMKSLICSYSSSSETLCRYTYIIARHCHNQIAYRELKEVPSHPPHPYRGTRLTNYISVWSGACRASDWKALQKVGRTAEKMIGTSLPPIQDIARKCCLTRTRCICGDSSHPTLWTVHPAALWEEACAEPPGSKIAFSNMPVPSWNPN